MISIFMYSATSLTCMVNAPVTAGAGIICLQLEAYSFKMQYLVDLCSKDSYFFNAEHFFKGNKIKLNLS